MHLQQPLLAGEVLTEALLHLPAHSRRRSIVLTDLAIASLQQRNVERASEYVQEIVDIGGQENSGWLKKGLQWLRTDLEPFATSRAARQLNEQFLPLS